ncbi:Ig-like domain-containing protein [Duffyella gerundensis]|uniref:Ig-like domain-containing protein n=1 Tax=Duffyella gerundensis TaxID=1619313 RepID=UPI00320AC7DA
MSDFPWDPTSGNADYTSSPYQYWAGSEPKEAGGKVEFVINNMLYTTNIEADGSWTFQLPVMLMDGQHNLSVRYIDRAMNYGPPYLSTIHVDTTPPAKPIIQAVQDDVGDSMPLFNGQITDDTKPRFSGSAEPQSIVRLFDKNTGALLGSAVANANGYWTIEEELGYGQREVFVTSSDRHNQASEPSESWVVNIKDPNVPPASDPYITGGADNVGAAQGELAFGAVTDDNRPTLKGMAEPGSIVWLFVKNAADQWLILGSTRAESNGSWSMETAQLNAGQYDFQVGSSDVRNPAADIFRLTIADAGSDALKPVIVDAFDDVGAATGALANGALTNDSTPTLRGTAEANSIVYIRYGRSTIGFEPVASVKANAKGEWSFTPELYQDHVWDFYVSSSTTFDYTNRFQLELKSSSALKPVIVDAYDDSGAATGALANGAVTDDRTPTLRGTAEANSIVYIHYGRSGVSWEPVASVKANAKGEWTFTPELYQDYTWDFYASPTTNWRDGTPVFQLELKSSSALKPVIVDAYDDSGAATGALANGAVTDDRTPTLRGTAEANSIVYLFAKGSAAGEWVLFASIKAGPAGDWQWSHSSDMARLEYQFQVGSVPERDVNGDIFRLTIADAGSSALRPVIVDAYDDSGAATGALANGAVTDDSTPTLRGTAEANSIVYLFAKGGAAGEWVLFASIKAGPAGDWQWNYGSDMARLEYQFQVGSVPERDVNGDIFRLTIADAGSNALKPVIVDAYDDSGAVTGALANGALTNDSTPTLRGTAEANSIVYIRYGRSTIGFEPVASVKANAKGEWSFTPELYQDHVWDFYVSSSTTFDYTRRFQIELDTMAGSPVIEGAWDNSGEGKLVAHNGYTKDTTPELRGTAEPNSTVTLQYVDRSRPWSQGTTVTVQAGPDGKWSHQLPALDNTYYHFRTKITDAAGNDSSYSANFLLYIDSIAPESPVITGVWDNEGSLRELANGDFTNDRTPEIRGTGEPNSKIIVVLAKGQEGWSNNNRTVETWADNNGNWKVTVPAPALTDDRWHFKAKAVDKAGNESALGAQAVIEVRGNLIDSRTVWDFNDGTLQGWTAAGKYAQSGQLLVGKWSAPANSNEAGSSTGGGDGFAGNVVYRDITVIKGQVYQFSFDVVRLNGSYTAPKLGMTVDGQTIISQSDVGQSWQNRSGSYIANETKTVRVAVTNGQNSGSGNDFAFDNIVINPIKKVPVQPDWKTSLETSFDGASLGGWTLKGKYANTGETSFVSGHSGRYLQFHTTAENNWSGEVMTRKMSVQAGKLYKFSFDAKEAHQTLAVASLSFEVDGVTVIAPQTLSRTAWNTYEGYFYATSTKVVDLKIKNSTAAYSGNNISLDNIRSEELLNPVDTNSNSRKFGQQEPLLFTPDEEQATLQLADALEGTVQKGVDLNGHGSTTLTVTAGDVLAFGEKDLFIADGRTQLMINGDASDVVNLDELLGESQDWSQLTGTMTVGGVEYNVWQHSGEDAELLIQSGVQTQLN